MSIKYTDKSGSEHVLKTNYKVNNVIVSQEKGQSTVDVMSQKAITDEIDNINNAISNINIPDVAEPQNINVSELDAEYDTTVSSVINSAQTSYYVSPVVISDELNTALKSLKPNDYITLAGIKFVTLKGYDEGNIDLVSLNNGIALYNEIVMVLSPEYRDGKLYTSITKMVNTSNINSYAYSKGSIDNKLMNTFSLTSNQIQISTPSGSRVDYDENYWNDFLNLKSYRDGCISVVFKDEYATQTYYINQYNSLKVGDIVNINGIVGKIDVESGTSDRKYYVYNAYLKDDRTKKYTIELNVSTSSNFVFAFIRNYHPVWHLNSRENMNFQNILNYEYGDTNYIYQFINSDNQTETKTVEANENIINCILGILTNDYYNVYISNNFNHKLECLNIYPNIEIVVRDKYNNNLAKCTIDRQSITAETTSYTVELEKLTEKVDLSDYYNKSEVDSLALPTTYLFDYNDFAENGEEWNSFKYNCIKSTFGESYRLSMKSDVFNYDLLQAIKPNDKIQIGYEVAIVENKYNSNNDTIIECRLQKENYFDAIYCDLRITYNENGSAIFDFVEKNNIHRNVNTDSFTKYTDLHSVFTNNPDVFDLPSNKQAVFEHITSENIKADTKYLLQYCNVGDTITFSNNGNKIIATCTYRYDSYDIYFSLMFKNYPTQTTYGTMRINADTDRSSYPWQITDLYVNISANVVPAYLSELKNDCNFITVSEVETKINEAHGSVPTLWSGTQAEYEALGDYDNNTLYLIK